MELLGPVEDDYDLARNDWVCNKCYKEIGFPKSGNNKSRFSQIRNEVLENTVKIDRDDACLIKDIVNNHKSILENNHTCIKDGEYDSFKKYLNHSLKTKDMNFIRPPKLQGACAIIPWYFLTPVYTMCIALQSNLDYPNPFGHGEIWNCSDKQKVQVTLTTPTRSIMHAKTYH